MSEARKAKDESFNKEKQVDKQRNKISFDGDESRVIQISRHESTVTQQLKIDLPRKEEFDNVNTRFGDYIKKVQALVSKNVTLETKMKECTKLIPSRSDELFKKQLQKLQKEIEKTIKEKTKVELELKKSYKELENYHKQLEREKKDRKDAEEEAERLHDQIDKATIVTVELEGEVETLREELELLRSSNYENIRALNEQLLTLQIEATDPSEANEVSQALSDIKFVYEQLILSIKIEIEEFYKSEILYLKTKLSQENDLGSNDDNDDLIRQLSNVTAELEITRRKNQELEEKLKRIEDNHNKQSVVYEEIIENCQKELQCSQQNVEKSAIDYLQKFGLKLTLNFELESGTLLEDGLKHSFNIAGSCKGYEKKSKETRIKYENNKHSSGGLKFEVSNHTYTEELERIVEKEYNLSSSSDSDD